MVINDHAKVNNLSIYKTNFFLLFYKMQTTIYYYVRYEFIPAIRHYIIMLEFLWTTK